MCYSISQIILTLQMRWLRFAEAPQSQQSFSWESGRAGMWTTPILHLTTVLCVSSHTITLTQVMYHLFISQKALFLHEPPSDLLVKSKKHGSKSIPCPWTRSWHLCSPLTKWLGTGSLSVPAGTEFILTLLTLCPPVAQPRHLKTTSLFRFSHPGILPHLRPVHQLEPTSFGPF